VEELRENIRAGLLVAKNKDKVKLSQAKVVGISCDVCKPDDVRKLSDFALDEFGSVDIWVSNVWTFCIFNLLMRL
jgi:chlorophyll(ide) b reductase